MTKKIEALKLALEALDQLTNVADTFSVSGVYLNEEVWAKKCLSDAYFAITTIEEALAVDKESLTTEARHMPSNDALYKAWNLIGADLAGLKFEDFVRHLLAQQSNEQVKPVGLVSRAAHMDVIVVNLVREGINKHRARDLAEHFLNYTHPPVPYVVEPRTAQPKAVAPQHKQEPKCIGKAWAMWGGPVVFDPPLTQTEQRSVNEHLEPVAWYRNEDIFGNQEMEPIFYATKAWVNCLPLYTHPPVPTAQPKEPEQEPVAWVYPEFWEHLKSVHCGTAYAFDGSGPNSDVERQPLYTTPPQRNPQFKEFIKWAGAQGYDCAQTCNSDTGKWIVLNPMTADLWKAWQAAHGIKE